MSDINLGIIGSSHIVLEHIKAFEAQGVNISCIAASDNSKTALDLSREINKCKYYETSESLIKENNYDALLIAPAIEPTSDILKLALVNNENIPILVEKPISLNEDEIKHFIKNENILVGYNRRFYKSVNLLKDKIDKDKSYFVNVINPETIFGTKNTLSKEYVYALRSNTVHVIDLLRYLFSDLEINFMSNKNENQGKNIIISNDKVNINFTLLWNSPMNTSIDVFYNQSRYELKPIEKFTFYDEMEIIEPNEDVHIRRYIPKPKDEHFINPGEFKPGFYDQAKAFKDFVLTNKIDNKFAKIEDAFFAQKLANEMSESYE